MQNWRKYTRYNIVFISLIVMAIVIILLNIYSGSVDITVKEIFNIIFKHTGDETQYNIIWKIRLPRIIISAVLGGALALSGFLLQTFFGNPIAGPFVLGISSGAKMCVAITLIIFLKYFSSVSSFALIAAAFAGSLLSMGFVLLMSRRIHHMSMLLVSGIMIGYICSAVTDFMVAFADDTDIVNLHNWSRGSFSGMSWDDVFIASVIVLITAVVVFFMSKPIGAYQLGEAYAQSMGVNIKVFRVLLILLSSLLSGCVTAFAGPISFLGIAVPHLMKTFLKTAKPIIAIPAIFMGGAVFCMFCDLIARTAFAPTELSISTVTAIFGEPVVIVMMLDKHRGR